MNSEILSKIGIAPVMVDHKNLINIILINNAPAK